MDRRSFLNIGTLGLGGLSLAGLLQARAAGGVQHLVRDKAVIFLFLHGGPSQTEMFDPKMDAPLGIRSVTGEVGTTIPGVTFGGTFQKLARLAHKFSVVRSFATGNGNHDIKPLVSKETFGASLGSLYGRVAGTSHPRTGMPRHIALYPRAVEPEAQPANRGFGDFASTGPLGAAYAPFEPGSKGKLQEDLKLAISPDRLAHRRSLLQSIDRLKYELDATGALEGLDRFREQAFSTILGGVTEAFDLAKEDPRVLAAYDTAPLVPVNTISKRWNNHKNYADNAQTLGRLLLLARRLCERGAGFVTVTTNFVWDMHADSNNATIEEGMGYVGRPFDHAVAAFIEDCEARGLRDKILLVACGEMGRTPRVNKNGGRDHWGNLSPLLLYGGGLKMGQVIGESSRDGGEPADNPITNADLVSTLFHTVLDTGELRASAGVSRELLAAVNDGRPIRQLF
jgi:hypothetical protein